MEEHNFDDCESIKGLSEFTKWVEAFCVSNKIVEYRDSDNYDYLINMPHEDILSLSSDECFANALTLMNYAGTIQKKHDIIDGQYQWCNEAMNMIYARYWDRYDKFLPAEVRKKSILMENSYAQAVEKYRIRLYAGMQILSETAKDIKKKVSLFQDLGKSRSFK